MTVIIYTDGACKAYDHKAAEAIGWGGWAWWADEHAWDAGSVPDATNNRMEMLAVIQALRWAKTHHTYDRLLIVSDSSYVVNCFADKWYVRWRENDWSQGLGGLKSKQIKNRDYWEPMLELYETHEAPITFRHCRGHGRGGPGDAPYVEGNAQADRLAVAARKFLERP
jgi:ribonuclease HI